MYDQNTLYETLRELMKYYFENIERQNDKYYTLIKQTSDIIISESAFQESNKHFFEFWVIQVQALAWAMYEIWRGDIVDF